ncbi:MAG: PAS domain S-box protein [Desulfovibrionaceae bacterium]
MDRLHRALLGASFCQTMILDTAGTVLAANDHMCSRLGMAGDRLVGSVIFDLFPPDIAVRRRGILEEVLHSGKPCRFRDVSASGVEFEARVEPVLDEDGNVLLAVIGLQDRTSSNKAEQERFRLATAIEQAMESIVILDEERYIQYANQAFESLTGYAGQEARGRKLDILFQGPEQEALLGNITASLKHGDTWAGRTNNTRKDGATYQSELTVTRIRGKRFLPLGYVCISRDVTTTALLEKQLRQAQKMEAIGTLASGIAHDFNNILGPIILHAEVSLPRAGADPLLRESLEEILSAANRASRLVQQILGLSRGRERDKPLPFRLGTIVKECLKILRPSLSAAIDIHYHNLAEGDVLRADPTQIHQVILNLCTNAAHAIGDKRGRIEIGVGDVTVTGRTLRDFPMLRPGHYLCLSVRDDGCGIPAGNLEAIFDPFFTTKQEGVGTGLGLTVVRNIVGGLGGALGVESRPGEGTEFKVWLPKCVNCEVEPLDKPLRSEDSRAHALLVDDDEVTVRGLGEHLTQLGFDVSYSRNGYEALALFRQDPERYDLALIDVAAPELCGLELAKELKLSRYDLPVVLLSAYTEVFPDHKARALGVQAFLRKPCAFEEVAGLLDAIRPRPRDQEDRPWRRS